MSIEMFSHALVASALILMSSEFNSAFAADAVGSSTMGIKCRSFTDEDQNFLKYGHKVLEVDRLGQLRLLLGMFFPNFARSLKLRQIPKDVSDFFWRVINDTVDKRRKNKIERNDLLQLLMNMQEKSETGKPLTLDEVISMSFGLFIGGFETSSNTMSFTLFSLTQHQDYQEKLRKEINTVLKNYDGKITYEAINEMTYLSQVVDETLRLYSPVPVANRVCTKDYHVPGENLVIEKGVKVLIPITGIHRDPDYYERPMEYYPDHFSKENKEKRHPFAFLPFGQGPRKCVGGRYGLLQVKLALAVIIRRYRVFLNNRTKLPLKLSPTALVPVSDSIVWLNFEKVQ